MFSRTCKKVSPLFCPTRVTSVYWTLVVNCFCTFSCNWSPSLHEFDKPLLDPALGFHSEVAVHIRLLLHEAICGGDAQACFPASVDAHPGRSFQSQALSGASGTTHHGLFGYSIERSFLELKPPKSQPTNAHSREYLPTSHLVFTKF